LLEKVVDVSLQHGNLADTIMRECRHSIAHEGIIILFTKGHLIRIPVFSEIVLHYLGCEINLL